MTSRGWRRFWASLCPLSRWDPQYPVYTDVLWGWLRIFWSQIIFPSVCNLVIKMMCVVPEWLWIYVLFGDLLCCFYIQSALLRIKSSNTKVLNFQLSVLNKLESAWCFGFLHFVFQYVVSGTLKRYWELMVVFFLSFPFRQLAYILLLSK